MSEQKHRLAIARIHIGFDGIVPSGNYMDSHRSLSPFGLNWGRGILIRCDRGLEAVTSGYGGSHSRLKRELLENETTAGAFYYGYVAGTRTLCLEYASDHMFDFTDEGVLPAIMDALEQDQGPLRGYTIVKAK